MGTYSAFYSHALGHDLGVMTYGHAGQPCLVFPSQNGSCRDFEGFGMIEPCTPYLKGGRLKLYCVDSVDEKTWSDYNSHPRERMQRHEAWFHHLTGEFVPFMYQDSAWQGRMMTLGCSMGATHAANALFRRPDLFETVIALSGAYDAGWLLAGYMDDLVYLNSPMHSVMGIAPGHPYIEMLNACKIILCCGQGAWEEEMLRSLRALEAEMIKKGIHAWVDIWGEDVAHDWPWWRRQLGYYLEKVL